MGPPPRPAPSRPRRATLHAASGWRCAAGAWLVYLLMLQPAAALYHTASETLHWFSHRAAAYPGKMK
jgi:hypothetical protein